MEMVSKLPHQSLNVSHDTYPLSVGRTCKDVGIVTLLIRLTLMDKGYRIVTSKITIYETLSWKLEREHPVDSDEVCCHVLRKPHG